MKRSNAQFTTALLTLFSGAVLASAVEPGTVRASIEAPKLRKAAPAFTLFDVSGKAVRLSDYRGKVVLLDFWQLNAEGAG